MMITRVDMHSHTTASDGTFHVKEIVARAIEKGLTGLAITDHDTVASLSEAVKEGEKAGIEVVPGIEISSVYNGMDVHILGYYVDYEDDDFLNTLEGLRDVRKVRNQMMIDKLRQLGIDITMEEVEKEKKGKGNTGRPHIASVLIQKGAVSTMKEAFDKYLGRGALAYCNPPRISPFEAIDIIKKAHGVPVVAHPGLYHDEELVLSLISYGVMGIEVFHPDHGEEEERIYGQMADHFQLIKTAGSDFHGIRSGVVFHGDLGDKGIDMETLIKIKKGKIS
ncbi:MAG TPA: phosphatase [Paenibacillaceae bacterium]|nr:phosphatase [Paenibacillaceae bacterium]